MVRHCSEYLHVVLRKQRCYTGRLCQFKKNKEVHCVLNNKYATAIKAKKNTQLKHGNRCNTFSVQPQGSSNSSRTWRSAKLHKATCKIFVSVITIIHYITFLLSPRTPYLTFRILSSGLHKTQSSSGSSCHQIHSVTSSPLSATPVTLPALSLYP